MGEAKRKNTKEKKSGLSPILKISLFTFLVWIAKSSNNDGHYGGANGAPNLEKSVTLRNGRLLSEQPQIEFESVFNTFKDGFLDKMGLGDQEQNQIKDIMHSYFKNLDLSALERQIQQNPEMFQQFAPNPNMPDQIQIPSNFLQQFPPLPGMLNPFNFPPNFLETSPPPPNMLEEFQKDLNKLGPFGPLPPNMSLPSGAGTGASSDRESQPETIPSFDAESQPETSPSFDAESQPETSEGLDLEHQLGTGSKEDDDEKETSSSKEDDGKRPGPDSKADAGENPGPSLGMSGPLPSFQALHELFRPPIPGACGNGQPSIPNFDFLEELQKNANLYGEIQKGANGVPGNLRGVDPNKDNNKEGGEQKGTNVAQGTGDAVEKIKEEKNEEATVGGNKKEKKKQVVVEEVEEERNSEVNVNESNNKDEVFEDAVEEVEDIQQPHSLPKLPPQKPEMSQIPLPPEQANFQPFANIAFPGMPNLDLLLGPQLANRQGTSALASFVNKLNFLGIDARFAVNTTFLAGLAYYKIKYFVYTMMFIIGLNLFRELGNIFSNLRR
ncbi:hypothetical protein C922_02257 [Plasmodium inui San Antonio 1]|uniref:Pv-fam-h protein n=1 Tax=Plasmodium inui San Antonio 1 TaxID=1237626 RepID=W7AQ66_9APIC|nr:hypothetical protein C922_02257 [Plasmodium inui San Antonio 1]EUD67551.1 hypothetical protein C922_02257 [Plasmodium inui San Antonio 1]